MKTKIGGRIFYLLKYIHFLFIILVVSCASTSVMRLEGSDFQDTDEVYGRIENSTLFITWSALEVEEEHKMKRDDSNNLILDGHWKGIASCRKGKVQFKKIE